MIRASALGLGFGLGLAAATVLGACNAPAPRALARSGARADHVVLVTIDGLMPATYLEPDAHGLAIPTLRAMVTGGAAATGARSVFPSVTYPAHTTLVTGVDPLRHGITTNLAADPMGRNQRGWRWYAEDIRSRTLWEAAREAGLSTALVNWPVTVGAAADVLVPEIWRAGTGDDQKLVRALSTPGILAEVAARHPHLWSQLTPPNVKDEATVDIAVDLLETRRPGFLALHIWEVDDAQHAAGPFSKEAVAAVEQADQQLKRLVEAAQRAGIWERTVIVVASDHGFASVDRELRPGVLLVRHGLIALDERGQVGSARATLDATGGLCFFYAHDDDPAVIASLRQIARDELLGRGVAHLYEAEEIRARGGDPRAALALGAADGYAFSGELTGPLVGPVKERGQHGYDPERPEMRASLLFYGPPVGPGRLEEARLVDVAPTVAGLLGLSLPDPDGRPLPLRSP